MSTLLTDLDSATPSKDGDLVDQILREMNSGGGPPPPAPGIPSSQGMIMDPMPNTAMNTRVMDAGPQTAHVIGGSQPTPADFAAAMHGVPYAPSAPFAPSGAAAPPPLPRARKSLVGKLTEEFKNPILVALLVFVFSLPVVNFLFAHYLPWSVLPTGQLTMVGLLLKSACAGGSFWVLQRIIIPLLNM